MTKDHQNHESPLGRVLARYFLTAKSTLSASALVIFIAITDVINPLFVMWAIDLIIETAEKHSTEAQIQEAYLRVCTFGLAMVGVLVAQYCARYYMTKIENRIIYNGSAALRNDLYKRLQEQSLSFHSERKIGTLLTHLMSDIQTLQDTSLDLVSELPFDAVTLLGLLVAMFFINGTLASIVVAFICVVTIGSLLIGRKGVETQKKVMAQSSALISQLHESLSGIKLISSCGASSDDRLRVSNASDSHAKDLVEAGGIKAAITPFFSAAEYLGILLVLLLGGWFALHGKMTAGGLVAFFAYMEMAAEPMVRGASIMSWAQSALASASRICEILSETEPAQIIDGTIRPATIRGDITVQRLNFSYPKAKRAALININFEIKGGETVAIIGPNGAGKSTILDLILKLHKAPSQSIKIDGVDLNDLAADAWRNLVGIVPQDIMLLNRSIAENIALGTAKLAQVEKAARLAGFHDTIMRLPQGYDTIPGERGILLSGGERQRIAIARLFLRDPRIVLLDEPTSALDVRSENELLPALQRLCAGRTTIIVSHRTALLNSADKILLLSDGKQLAFFTPSKLWNSFPEYRDLFPMAWQTSNQPIEVHQ
jgi:ABC-type multidrug transport system fused ATPase/permease subunit